MNKKQTPLTSQQWESLHDLGWSGSLEIDSRVVGGKTPLFYALADLELCQDCLDAGANPNAEDENGKTPLFYVLTQKNQDCFDALNLTKALLKAGANVNLSNHSGRTPLMMAAFHCWSMPGLIEILLDSGANLKAINSDGDDVWDYANRDRSGQSKMTIQSWLDCKNLKSSLPESSPTPQSRSRL